MFIIVELQPFMNVKMKHRTESLETDLLNQAISAFNERFEGSKASN